MVIPKGFKNTEVGIIPKDWEVRNIGMVSQIKLGGTPSTLVPDFWGGDIEWCTPTDITNCKTKYLQSTDRKITKKGLTSCSATLLPKGTLLLCTRATIGDVKIASNPISTNQGFKSLIVDKDTSNEWLYYLLLSLKEKMCSLSTGSTFLELSRTALEKIYVPYPPFNEQKSIASVLSNLDNLIESLEKLIDKKRNIKEGAMQDLLSGKKRLSGFIGKWKRASFKELFNIFGGFTATRNDLSFNGYCYLHYGDIHKSNKNTIDTKNDYFSIPKLSIPLSKVSPFSLLKDGDIVFVDASEDDEGASKHVVVRNTSDIPFISGLHTIIARPKTNELAITFCEYCFKTEDIKRQFKYYSAGTKVTGISKTNILKLNLTYPPTLAEQTSIADILTNMDNEISALENKFAKYKQIKIGVMQQLLTGKIRLSKE